MSPARQATYWALAMALLLVAVYLLSTIIVPFVAGLAIAYFLDPIVDRLETHKLGRALATTIVLLLFFLFLVGSLFLLAPVLLDQIFGFVESFPGYVLKARDVLLPWVSKIGAQFGINIEADAKAAMANISKNAMSFAAGLVQRVWSGGMAFFHLLSLLVISPIVAFYILRDWDRLTAKIDGWLPRQHEPEIRKILVDVDAVLAGFVRGQGTVCLILGTFYALGLSLAGLDFGLFIGLFAGLVSFIPFVGVIVGLILSMMTALTQFWPDYTSIGIVASVFVIGQMLEGYVLTPRLLGNKVGLHPVWVIFALLAGGALFGFVGVLIAIPVAAVIGVLARYFITHYLGSQLYLGPAGLQPTSGENSSDKMEIESD